MTPRISLICAPPHRNPGMYSVDLAFDRVLLMFDAAQRDAAADLWRRFAKDDAIDNRINKQDENGAWREGR